MLLREMTSYAFAHSFKRFAQCAVAGLALAGLAACGGGGSSTPARTAPTPMEDPTPMEMNIEPSEDGTTQLSCFTAGSGTRDACVYSVSDGSPCDEGDREVQQCPRAGDEYASITECIFGSAGSFIYERAVQLSSVEERRRACGQDRGRFVVHKQPVFAPPPDPSSGNSYGSLAFAVGSYGRTAGGSGDSQSSARNAALAACSDGGYIGCREVLWFRNACGTVALSTDTSRAGVGWGTSHGDAAQKAIAACSAAGGQSCRVATAINGRPFEYCVRSGSSPASGQASIIPPRPSSPSLQQQPQQQQQQQPQQQQQQQPQQQSTYVSISYGERSNPDPRGRDAWAWATGRGTSAIEAERDAMSDCGNLLGSRCTSTSDGYTGCLAIALSECTGECKNPAAAVGGGTTREAAETAAIRGCRSIASPASIGNTCDVSSSQDGRPGVVCGSAGQ